MNVTWRFGAIAVLGLLASCSDSTIALSIDLRTDLSPGNEFQRIVTSLVGEGVEQERGTAGDFITGARVADFEGLGASESRTVRVDLLDGSGALVVSGEILVNHRENRGVVLVVTRDCRDVSCGEGTTCRGGSCVAADCVDGTEPSCPEPECRADVDCAAADACSMAQCAEGVCFYRPLVGACSSEEYCDPERGCLPVVMTQPDAGLMDGGIDAGADSGSDAGSDAGNDVPSVPLAATRGIWPPNGSYTGVSNRQPRFIWEAVAGATEYQLQADNSCPAEQGSCDFRSPELDVRTSELRHDPEEPLVDPVATQGQRFQWRVRGCRDDECGPWSSPRYVEVGASELDVDGDARADLVIGNDDSLVVLVFEGTSPTEGVRFSSDPVVALERGDFNADGYSDVFKLAERGGALSVEVYYGSRDGLQPGMRLPSPRDLRTATNVTCSVDFDADGYRDVAVQDSSASFVFWGSAAGLEDTPVIVPSTFSTCGDVNIDGFADLVGRSGAVSGKDLRSAPTAIAIGVTDFQFVGDVNGDGYRDALVSGTRLAELISGNGDGFDSPRQIDAGINLDSHVQMVEVANVDRFGGSGQDAVWADAAFLGERMDTRSGFGGVAFQSGSRAVFLNGPCDCDGLGMEVRFGMDLNSDTFGDVAVAHEGGAYFFFGQPGGYTASPRTYVHREGRLGTSL